MFHEFGNPYSSPLPAEPIVFGCCVFSAQVVLVWNAIMLPQDRHVPNPRYLICHMVLQVAPSKVNQQHYNSEHSTRKSANNYHENHFTSTSTAVGWLVLEAQGENNQP